MVESSVPTTQINLRTINDEGMSPRLSNCGTPPLEDCTAAGPIRMRTIRGTDSDTPWSLFVECHYGGTLFHTLGWRDAVQRTFGHEPFYLLAERSDRVVGVFPSFLVSRPFGRPTLVSVPYGVGGGLLAESPQVAEALWEEVRRFAGERRCGLVDLRSETASIADLKAVAKYAAFRRELPASPTEVLGWLPRKARAVVRQARDRFGLTLDLGDEHLSTVWDLYTRNMRRLGSINYPRRFFEELIRAFPNAHWTAVVRRSGRAVGGLVTFLHKERVMPYFFGCAQEARSCGAANYLYFRMMQHGVEHGYRVFDFGRSRKDNKGSFEFKRLQGFNPKPLEYQIFVPDGDRSKSWTPDNPRLQLARAVWRVLPLAVTRPLGARLSRYIPG